MGCRVPRWSDVRSISAAKPDDNHLVSREAHQPFHSRLPAWLTETLGFLTIALVATWPLARYLTSRAPGANVWNGRVIYFETPVNLWNLWWFRHALVNLHQNPFNCTYLFYPFGANLWFHTLSPLPALVGVVLQTMVGLVAAHNVLVITSIVAAGLSTAALARHLGVDRPASFLAGAIFACSPAVFSHLYVGHFELLWTFWLPAVLLVFLRVVDGAGAPTAETWPARHARWHRPALLGVMIAGAAYTSAYYAVYSIELLTVAALVRWRSVWRLSVMSRLALAALVAAVCVAPLVRHFGEEAASLTNAQDTNRYFREFSIDPLALVVPSFAHPILSVPFRGLYTRMNRGIAMPQETTGYLGLTVIGLAVFALVRRRHGRGDRERQNGRPEGPPPRAGATFNGRLSVVVAAVFLVLSFGAELKWNGSYRGLPMPAAALAHVPIVRLARAPGRHVIVAMLAVAVLAAAGWQRLGRSRLRFALLAAIACEYAPMPLPLFVADVPDVYRRIAEDPGLFAVLDVPVGVRDGTQVIGHPDASELLAQTVHQKPIVGGMVSRVPDEKWDAIRHAPLIAALLSPNHNEPVQPAEAAAYFAKWNIRAIVIHPNASDIERHLIESSLPVIRRERFADGMELWWTSPH
jgi:hypothetical protein